MKNRKHNSHHNIIINILQQQERRCPSSPRSGRSEKVVCILSSTDTSADDDDNGATSTGSTTASTTDPPPSSSSSSSSAPERSTCRARDLIHSLVVDSKCYSTQEGARAFVDACSINVRYEDRYESQPKMGRIEVLEYMFDKVQQRQGRGQVRLDRISDGNIACGFCWTWISGNEEGLRGTTYIELDPDTYQIIYVQEIPEPLFKPGDATKQILETITRDSIPKEPQPYQQRTPTKAFDLAKYLFQDLQYAGVNASINELMRFIDQDIIYRDFNYENLMRGPDEVRQFVLDFSFPGIEFRPLRFDDGITSTCFTWEVILDGMENDPTVQPIQGISFYELDPISRKIIYIRDVPESAIKPPILGKLARQYRPGLGVFKGVPIKSRPGGM